MIARVLDESERKLFEAKEVSQADPVLRSHFEYALLACQPIWTVIYGPWQTYGLTEGEAKEDMTRDTYTQVMNKSEAMYWTVSCHLTTFGAFSRPLVWV